VEPLVADHELINGIGVAPDYCVPLTAHDLSTGRPRHHQGAHPARQLTLAGQTAGKLPVTHANCNLAIIWPGPQLPFRDNTLHEIPSRPQTKKSSPGGHHS
jgi:hypothetical protein